MIPAQYSLIRYIPDPARNEPLNVGILVWSGSGIRLRLEPQALERIIRENPHFQKSALSLLEDSLASEVAQAARDEPLRAVPRFLDEQRGFPVLFSEARHTMIEAETEEALDETLTRLLERIVRPRRRPGGSSVPSLSDQMAKQLAPLIKHGVVTTNHPLHTGRSGVMRSVQFYRNSTTHTAVDTLRLSLKRADDIALRADAEAFKIDDIKSGNNDIKFVVLCDLPADEDMLPAADGAKTVLASVGASVTTDVAGAAAALSGATPIWGLALDEL
jgi:hypothetical protein